MAINPEQREKRRRYIGSSDCAAIMGLDCYRSAADVWLEKTGRVDGFSGNDATDAGTLLERAVLDWAEKEIGQRLDRDVFRAKGNRCANYDAVPALGSSQTFIVEAKTSGIVGPADPAYGEPGSDELPDRVLIQVHHQFGVCNKAFALAYVPVLIGGVGFRMYKVTRNDELVATVIGAAEKFWTDHVAADVQPNDFKPSLEVLKRMRRVPKLVKVIKPELAEDLIVARAARLQADKDEKAAEVALLAAMGEAEAVDFGDGKLITYFEYQRKSYTVEAGTFRRLGFPKVKRQITESVGAA